LSLHCTRNMNHIFCLYPTEYIAKQNIWKNFSISINQLTQYIALTLFITFLLPYFSFSQQNDHYSHAAYAEKIYLQLDSKVYTTDRTIWYKCIVVSAMDNAPNTLSGVLYVELIDPDEAIVDKKTIKIENGIGDGFFELNDNYSEGIYLIRAYTEWNKNFDPDFFFKEYIQVFATSAGVKKNPISNVTLIEKPNSILKLSASLDPLVLDRMHEKELALYIISDGKRDTLSIKQNRDGKYKVDYIVPAGCQLVTLQIQTKNHFRYSRTIDVNEDQLDLQFFPESGDLVQGLHCKVGFKAVDSRGKGRLVEGEIINGQGEVVTRFRSNELGMGSITLTNADSSADYAARLVSQSEDSLSTMYSLPEVRAKGNVLTITRIEDNIQLKATSNYLINDSIYFRASCRGVIYYDLGGRLYNGILTLSLPASMLPDGIIAFTLMDNLKQPVAERLYFNERPESRINIDLHLDRDIYKQRDLTKLNFETTNNEGEVAKANLSILVLNKDQMGQLQSTRQNILSYFLLSSDLKGEIEDPGSYFNQEHDQRADLDALMLTQGWRRYLYTIPTGEFPFKPEPQLTISGSVGGTIFKNRKKEVELTMMTFGNSRTVQSQMTDTLGRFNFLVNEEYSQDLNILIQSAKKSGKKKNFSITIDQKISPAISFNHLKTIESADSVVHELVEKNIERKTVEEAYQLSNGAIPLEEVVIEGYKMTPERMRVASRYGKPDHIISGKTLQEQEERWSYGLFSVLKYKYPDKITIHKINLWDGSSYLYAHAGAEYGMTLIVIDGIPIRYTEYFMVAYIPISEVSSFEIIENAKNYASLFSEVFPLVSPLDIPSSGSIIAIYTYAGKGMSGINKPVGILKTSVPVFSPRREFYAPKYDKIQPDDWYKPDLRALIHWEPDVVVDSLGEASTTFYNADNIGEMLIVVEAISENGELGYKEITYNVKKNETGF